jgi:heat shock protein HslJ/membrane-bound inhibitor of C-type lysozyme
MIKKTYRTWRLGAILSIILIILAGAALTNAGPDGELSIVIDGRTHVLKRVSSASGERYENPDDPSIYFWSDGLDADLSLGGRECSRYVLIRGSSDSDEFTLTVDGKNYEMSRVISASGAKYEADGDPQTALWSKGDSALLYVGGHEYVGYDIWRPDGEIWMADRRPPTEVEWDVSNLAGIDVIDGSRATVTFHSDGKLSGNATVNEFTSTWINSGGRIMIGECAVTRKAGPPQLMEQEETFLDLLSGAVRFDFRDDGMVLSTGDGREIVLVR